MANKELKTIKLYITVQQYELKVLIAFAFNTIRQQIRAVAPCSDRYPRYV